MVLVVAAVLAVLLTRSNPSVSVPNVTGQTEQAAGATLRSAGLVPASSLKPSVKVASGLVISQSPVAADIVKKGTG